MTLRRLRRFFTTGFSLLVLLCHGSLWAQPKVVIITPHSEEIRREFARAFTEWHQETYGERVDIDWRDPGGTSDSLRFVQSEFANKPDGIGVDCFFGGGPEPYLLLADKKLTDPYKPAPEILAGIPQSFNGVEVYDAQHRWYGAALSSFGILQNTRIQKLTGMPLVTRWEELAQPQLYGWVGAGDPRNSGTMNAMFEAFLQAYGWDKGWQLLTEIGGNVRKFDRVSSTTAKEVTLGETAYAFAIDFYGFTQIAMAGRTNMTFALPEDFTAISPDGIAILRGAPNRQYAQRFVDFVIGEPGQRLWFLPLGHPLGPQSHSIERMSVRPDFYERYKDVSNIAFSPFTLKQNFIYNAKLARARREVVASLVGALLVDTHSELQTAWRAVIDRKLNPADVAELGRVPLTEAEANELAAEKWKDAGFRNRKKIEWQAWAQQKYRRLVEAPATASTNHSRSATAQTVQP